MNAITQFGSRSLQLGKDYSPEIMAGVGVVGVVTSGVLAARATLKLENVVAKFENAKQEVNDLAGSEENHKKLMFAVHRAFVWDLVKLYGPSVTLGAVSLASIMGGVGLLRKRNVALLGSYKTLEQAYSEYRKRVKDELGEEKEREIRLGLRALDDDFVVKDEDDKTDEEATIEAAKRKVLGASAYAVFFDRYNRKYESNMDYNVAWLSAQQNYLNDQFIARGYLFLNDVLDALGFDKTEAGQHVGWFLGGDGDNYVDFGVDRGATLLRDRYQFEEDGSILLDFNVDGEITSKVWPKKKSKK